MVTLGACSPGFALAGDIDRDRPGPVLDRTARTRQCNFFETILPGDEHRLVGDLGESSP